MPATTATSARPLVAPTFSRIFRMEVGLRDGVLWTSAGEGVSFDATIGAGHATATLTITVNALDLFEVLFTSRRGARRTLGALADVHAADLERLIVAEWCAICSALGW